MFYLNEANWISDVLRTIQVKLSTRRPDYFLFQGLKDRGTSSRITNNINMMTKIKGTVITGYFFHVENSSLKSLLLVMIEK